MLKRKEKSNMYTSDFVSIYEQYGWNDFALQIGEALYSYLSQSKASIYHHLDLCSGTGVLCHFFYTKGCVTKGVDLSLAMIELAKSKYKEIDFICSDVLDYHDDQHYDLITCTCDSLNHFTNQDDLKRLLKRVSSLLNETGYFVFDVILKETVQFDLPLFSVRSEDTLVKYLIHDLGHSLIQLNIQVFFNEKLIFENQLVERIYSLEEIKMNLEQNGFQIELMDDKIGKEEQRVNNKMFFIVRKKR
mgnify:CR=1 FL=1